ncbi:hypothetical protein [Xenorhabdus anantnagensis]|uniref:Uncharacterized protein n=1 Tax=Xenorhabdus anantnagensis TaxID=3025875 RepID=A0ABT5LWZ7_9GAMM|nr:hypothetical protein [Xenorhabdus anantnagensis]MDC9598952.1 hypothetical protein [Xenorhabdus anantnagensis]
MRNEFKNNTVNDIASRLKVAANVAKTYSGNEITVNCDELLKLCEAAKKFADYEIIINAYHQDDADWHKLADINGSAICALVDGIIKLQSKLAEYENMEPYIWGVYSKEFDTIIGYEITEHSAKVVADSLTENSPSGDLHSIFPLYRHPSK